MGGEDSGDKPGSSSVTPAAASAATSAACAPPPPELHGSQDVLTWKREYNIRQREADWKRKQEELLTQKQVSWQIERCERENRLTSARENRIREDLERRVHTRHVDVDRRYKERCRTVEIDKRTSAWEEKENARLVTMHREAKESSKEHQEALLAEKAKLLEDMRKAAADRAEQKRKQAEMNAKREENIRKREKERLAKASAIAHKLKQDPTAKSNAVVNNFADRTIAGSPDLVGVMTRSTRTHSHDGPSPGSIL